MGLFSTIGSIGGGIIGGIYGGPAGAAAGSSIGGGLGGMLDENGNQKNTSSDYNASIDKAIAGYNKAGTQLTSGYDAASGMYQPGIDQTSGSISQYKDLLEGLGKGYESSPGLNAELGTLNKKLAAMGLSQSPTGVGTSYAPLVAADYNNFFNRQLNTLNAEKPLMDIYQSGTQNQVGLKTSLADKLAALTTTSGEVSAGLGIGNIKLGNESTQRQNDLLSGLTPQITDILKGLFKNGSQPQSGGYTASSGLT